MSGPYDDYLCPFCCADLSATGRTGSTTHSGRSHSLLDIDDVLNDEDFT